MTGASPTLLLSILLDIVTLADGRRFEGTVLSDDGSTLVLRRRHDEFHMDRRNVAKVEKAPLSWEEYAAKAAALKPDTAAGEHAALAKWCRERKLIDEARAQWEAVLAKAPENAEARAALNWRKVDGKWVRDLALWAADWVKADASLGSPPVAPPDELERRSKHRADAGDWLRASGEQRQAELLAQLTQCVMQGDAAARHEAAAALKASGVPLAALEVLAHRLDFSDPAAAPDSIEFAWNEAGDRAPCFLALPDRRRFPGPRPVLVSMHVTSGPARNRRDRFAVLARESGWIIAAPHSEPNFGKGWGSTEAERRVTLAALDAVLRRCPADPDRAFINGSSMGGNGAWEIAMLHPDRWAGAAPWISGARVRTMPFLANLRGLPLQARVGALEDGLMLEATREAAAFLREGLGSPAALEEEPDWGHMDKDETWIAAFAEWAAPIRRNVYSPAIVQRFVTVAQSRHHWLAAETLRGPAPVDPTRGDIPVSATGTEAERRREYVKKGRDGTALLTGRVAGQKISIEARKVGRLTVWFSDNLVDLDRDVIVEINGKRAFSGKIERRFEDFIDEIAASGDAGRIYVARKSFEVK
ncbi:MAG: hypothetical protein AAB074_10675 [Planctomycetota bacterium]